MTEPTGGSADATAATTTETGTATTTVQATTPEVAAPSKDDWAGLAKSLRTIATQNQTLIEALAKGGAKPEPPKVQPTVTSSVSSVDTETKLRLDLSDAIDESGLSISPAHKAVIKRLHAAEKPGNTKEWLAETAKALTGGATQAATGQNAVVAASTNTGPAAATTTVPTLPANPLLWPEDVIRRTPPVEYMAALKSFQSGQGGRGWNPYASMKRAHEK